MADAKPIPSVEDLNRMFTLDRVAGHLYWNPRPRSEFPNDKQFRFWNTYCAGKRADKPFATGYLRVRMRVDGKSSEFSAHRLIWKMIHGHDPLPLIDHIDRNRANNRPSNLRQADYSMNMMNRDPNSRRAPRSGTALCVYPTRSGKFRAQINLNGALLHLGTFASQADAARAVAAARASA